MRREYHRNLKKRKREAKFGNVPKPPMPMPPPPPPKPKPPSPAARRSW